MGGGRIEVEIGGSKGQENGEREENRSPAMKESRTSRSSHSRSRASLRVLFWPRCQKFFRGQRDGMDRDA